MLEIQAVMAICSTLLICTGAFLAVLLYLGECGLFRVTIQVAAMPAQPPNVILQQSAGQVFSNGRRFSGAR